MKPMFQARFGLLWHDGDVKTCTEAGKINDNHRTKNLAKPKPNQSKTKNIAKTMVSINFCPKML